RPADDRRGRLTRAVDRIRNFTAYAGAAVGHLCRCSGDARRDDLDAARSRTWPARTDGGHAVWTDGRGMGADDALSAARSNPVRHSSGGGMAACLMDVRACPLWGAYAGDTLRQHADESGKFRRVF